MLRRSAPQITATPENPDDRRADNDQIDRSDIVQRSRHHKNKNAARDREVALRLPYRHPLASLPFPVDFRLYVAQRVPEQRPE
jgi:hypothetical protein